MEKSISFKNNMKILWGISKPYFGIFLLIVFFVMLITIAKFVEKYIFKVLIDNGTTFASGGITSEAFISILITIAIVFIASMAVKSISNWLEVHLLIRLETKIMYSIKTKFFNHIVGLSHKFHTTHKTGSLISRLGRGIKAIENILDFFIFNGAPLVLNLAIVGASVYYFDKTSAIVLLLTAAVFITFSILVINNSKKKRLNANNAEDIEKGSIADFFANIDSIKYFGKEENIKHRFSKLAGSTRDKTTIAWDFHKWLEFGQLVVISLGFILLFYFPLMKFINGELTIGTLVFIYTVYGNAAEPLYGFTWGVRRFYEAMADLEGLFEYDKIKNDIVDKKNAKELKVEHGEIEFKNVSFGYHNSRDVIKNFTLKVRPHEKVAFVGHSGSGKTTIVKLLYRFYDSNLGEVLIDGKNIKDFKQESLRSELSIVPQECVLFDDSIYSNIAFSKPSASRREVMNAIKFAQLESFVNSLPKKENTIVGERGVKLSGGEKQRVSIARALLANKKVLVLDEATSSLDSKTESQIQEELERLMSGRTSLIIAHRLSTIMKADRIVVLDKGRIVQVGNHKELIKQEGIYKELWGLQKGGYIK